MPTTRSFTRKRQSENALCISDLTATDTSAIKLTTPTPNRRTTKEETSAKGEIHSSPPSQIAAEGAGMVSVVSLEILKKELRVAAANTQKLEKAIKKLEKKNAESTKFMERFVEENRQLRAEIRAYKGKVVLDICEVEEYIVCEICSCTLWDPFLLPDCGHTFCGGCLEGWFTRIKVQLQSSQSIEELTAPRVFEWYNCPKCRKSVANRPMRQYSVQYLVEAIARGSVEVNLGEGELERGNGLEGRGGVRHVERNRIKEGTWNQFF